MTELWDGKSMDGQSNGEDHWMDELELADIRQTADDLVDDEASVFQTARIKEQLILGIILRYGVNINTEPTEDRVKMITALTNQVVQDHEEIGYQKAFLILNQFQDLSKFHRGNWSQTSTVCNHLFNLIATRRSFATELTEAEKADLRQQYEADIDKYINRDVDNFTSIEEYRKKRGLLELRKKILE